MQKALTQPSPVRVSFLSNSTQKTILVSHQKTTLVSHPKTTNKKWYHVIPKQRHSNFRSPELVVLKLYWFRGISS